MSYRTHDSNSIGPSVTGFWCFEWVESGDSWGDLRRVMANVMPLSSPARSAFGDYLLERNIKIFKDSSSTFRTNHR